MRYPLPDDPSVAISDVLSFWAIAAKISTYAPATLCRPALSDVSPVVKSTAAVIQVSVQRMTFPCGFSSVEWTDVCELFGASQGMQDVEPL